MFHDLQICHILMYSFLAYVLCLRVCACSLTHLSNAVEGIEVELLARVEEKKFTHTVFVLAGHGRHLNWGQFFPEQWLTARSTVLRGFHVLVRAFFGGKLGSQLGWGTFRGSHLASGHNMIRIHFRFRSHRKSAKVPAGRAGPPAARAASTRRSIRSTERRAVCKYTGTVRRVYGMARACQEDLRKFWKKGTTCIYCDRMQYSCAFVPAFCGNLEGVPTASLSRI